MGHHVHFPHALDPGVVVLEATQGHIARVRDEQPDRAVIAGRPLHELDEGRFVSDVECGGAAADGAGHLGGTVTVEIGHDDVPCVAPAQLSRQRRTDAGAATGDDHVATGEFHGASL